MMPFQRILVPTDFGPAAQHAADLAVSIGERFDSTITILHVYTLPSAFAPYLETMPLPTHDFVTAARQALSLEVDRVKKRYGRVTPELASGFAWQEIIEYTKTGFDLVVMGTHGRKGISRLVLGSVAEKLVRLSPIPVLTVPSEPHVAQPARRGAPSTEPSASTPH
ncbi:MAG TPA: universal stress protein [Polyangiaceae bacterium]|jgi:nucleotide-binding universal stress UspA family protein|nr:universal stress protein [Polyangiaceae bacterium]